MPRLSIEFVLVQVVLLLKFIRHIPYDVVFCLQQTFLLVVVLHNHLTLSQLSWQIVRVDIDLHFELFRSGVLYVLAQLFVVSQESNLVRGSFGSG